ncbi:aspartyl-phosphate phosphatase Spo0E family protein [Effusibacillus dendaii]|uniref:Aspartyl-phosphate phosphatase Spo0E family protein n=1 Tax=Effusibacillus dendaii TaxID=2743772 RepID=A0A7I8D7T7_9BACL|nr:aspartyl-phosphate phosphatase Spo0E family protein [Effusibacillus dendaii]BCJ86174.1 hypothetical protein skT53_11590 [Effusibacillus dendaii]
MKNQSVLKQIDQLRTELQILTKQKGSFLDPSVLEMSQRLDRLILLIYKQNGQAYRETGVVWMR